jgi:hypothetical protein
MKFKHGDRINAYPRNSEEYHKYYVVKKEGHYYFSYTKNGQNNYDIQEGEGWQDIQDCMDHWAIVQGWTYKFLRDDGVLVDIKTNKPVFIGRVIKD